MSELGRVVRLHAWRHVKFPCHSMLGDDGLRLSTHYLTPAAESACPFVAQRMPCWQASLGEEPRFTQAVKNGLSFTKGTGAEDKVSCLKTVHSKYP